MGAGSDSQGSGVADAVTKYALDQNVTSAAALSPHLKPDTFLSLGSMEGMFEAVVSPSRVEVPPHPWIKLAPGYVLSILVAGLAYVLHVVPFAPFTITGEGGIVRHPIGPAIIAVLIGLLIRNTLAVPDVFKAGCKSAIRTYIPVAIVLTGGGLNLTVISQVGARAFLVIATCIIVALVGGYYLGRLCKLNPKTSLLIGAGTAICGNSAIVATAPLLDAEDDDIVLSIGTVNLFGLLAMLAWPFLGGLMALSPHAFGIWAGTSIHAVPQAVAAGFAFSFEAGTIATLVKLVRVACLAPMVFFLAIYHSRRHARNGDGLTVHYFRLVPWFVWGFLILSVANTFGLMPEMAFRPWSPFASVSDPIIIQVSAACTFAANLLLTMDMAAIGLEVNLRQLASVGGRALLAGLLATLAVAATGLLVMAIVF